MATKNRIDLIVDGQRVYSRSTTREYAWALVGVKNTGNSRTGKLRITNCGNDRRALERYRDEARTWAEPRHMVLYPIVDRVVRAASVDLLTDDELVAKYNPGRVSTPGCTVLEWARATMANQFHRDTMSDAEADARTLGGR